METIERTVPALQIEVIVQGRARGRSLGIARHWEPVLRIYISAR